MAIKMLSVDIDNDNVIELDRKWTERDTLFHTSNRYIDWFNQKGKKCRHHLDVIIDVFYLYSPEYLGDNKSSVRFQNSKLKFTLNGNGTNQTNWMPITPWIAAHRLWHAAVHFKLHKLDFSYNSEIFPWIDSENHGVAENEQIDEILTMKSARDKKLNLWLDIEAEMFAQWFITGRIKFKKYQHLESEVNQMFEQMFEEEINGYHWVW